MQKIFSKKLLFLIPIFVFLGLFLFGAHQAKAQFGGIIGDAAMDILQGVFYILQQFGGLFAGFCGNLFTKITDFGFNNEASMQTVRDGWTITRDIVNMFFILGLVVIAFATILRTETYGMKALLPKFIVVALLINFSYLICGIIIDASQVVVDYFTELINPEGSVDVGLQLLDTLGVQNSITSRGEVSVAISEINPEVTTTLTMGFNAAILFVAGFVLLVGTILLFLRVGALWVLIILSPFAWFFSIFPYLQEHSKKWWSEFLKWVLFAPVYIFFIYLVLKLSESSLFNNLTESPSIVADMTISPMLQDLNLLFQYVFLVVLLLGAPTVAMSMGIKAAGAAQTFVKGGLRLAYKIPGRLRAGMIAPPGWMKAIPGVRRVAAGLSFVAKWTTPELWKETIKRRKEERMREARIPRQIGRQQDLMNRVLSLWTRRTSHAEEMEEYEVQEKKKEIMAETKGIGAKIVAKKDEAYKRGKDGIVDYKGATELLGEHGDFNDSMIFSNSSDDIKYDEKLALPELKGKNVNDPKRRKFSNLGFKHTVIQQMRRMKASDEEIAAFLTKLSEIGLSVGYFGLYGMGKVNKETGKPQIASDQEQIDVAAYKYKVMTPRARTSKLHATSFVKQGGTADHYDFVDWDEVGKHLLKATSEGDVAKMNVEYVRPDTRDNVSEGFEKLPDALREVSDSAYHLGEKFEHFQKTGEDISAARPKPATPPPPRREATKGPTEKDREEWRKKQGITE